ncbi:MAG: TetR/AcrR family transcriptional regulator [Rhodoglobus sp.]
MVRPSQPLSTDLIAQAALDLIDEDKAPSMRAIARRLGVSAPSLYHHVSSKDDVVNLIRDVLSASALPSPAYATWREQAEDMFRGLYGLYAARPRLAELFVRSPIKSLRVLDAYGDLARQMMSDGFTPRDVAVVLEMLDSYAIGLGLGHAAPATVWDVEGESHPLALAAAAVVHRDRLDEAFERGLILILDGAQRLLEPR